MFSPTKRNHRRFLPTINARMLYVCRLKEPQPVSPWPGVWNATAPGNACLGIDYKGGIVGQEDCLYLNVYTPKVNTVFTVFR